MLTIPTRYSGDEIVLIRSCTSLLNMKAYPVDLSPLGFICPPMKTGCALRNTGNYVNLSLSRYFGLQGVEFSTSLYPLLRPLDGSLDNSFRMFLPHDVLFLDVISV